MILAEEANSDGAEDVKAAGHPCYDDLLEENMYLRSEVSRFYEEVVILPSIVEENSNIIAIRPIEFESFVTEQKSSFKDLLSKFKALEIDFDHLQSHSSQQAIESKRASRTIEELQYELNAANAEILQILPLRLKLTESNKKVENLRRDNLATGEQLSNTQLEKNILLSKLDRWRSSLEDMQNSLKNEVLKSVSSDEKIKGLHEVVEQLEASMIEKSLVIQIHEDSIKKLHENLILLRGDSAHWERKSVSASKELLRLSNLEHFHAVEDNVDLLEKNSALKTKLKLREEAIKDILRQSSLVRKVSGSRLLKRARCANMRACVLVQRMSQRSTATVSKSCNNSVTYGAPSETPRVTVPKSRDSINAEISGCKMKDMGIEMTCESIDDQDAGAEMCDEDDMVDQNCLCGGLSFLFRRL